MLTGVGARRAGDEDLCRVINEMDASAFTAASAAAADSDVAYDDKNEPTNITPI